ncbi:hypothetical protein FMEAI12_2790001 [Parafrankia sp. Ea1.12]|nr:hypothetical protein FMEAI12_2790001 [Parafrankia sp. Ea1.12]
MTIMRPAPRRRIAPGHRLRPTSGTPQDRRVSQNPCSWLTDEFRAPTGPVSQVSGWHSQAREGLGSALTGTAVARQPGEISRCGWVIFLWLIVSSLCDGGCSCRRCQHGGCAGKVTASQERERCGMHEHLRRFGTDPDSTDPVGCQKSA